MNSDPLPPDLRELEAKLARRPGPEPSPALRARVLSAGGEVAPRPSRAWRLAGWVAAILVLLNMVESIANGVRYQRLSETSNVDRPARPPLPDEGDPFQQYAANALASLSPSPSSGSPDRSLFSRWSSLSGDR